jgi:hypothetical protein
MKYCRTIHDLMFLIVALDNLNRLRGVDFNDVIFFSGFLSRTFNH